MRVEASTIEGILDEANSAVEEGSGLEGTGFWNAVATVKRDPALIPRFADRISEIDRRAFLSWALVTLPIVSGTVLMVIATVVGVGLIGSSFFTEDELTKLAVFAVGFGVVFVTTHGLAHLAVGRAVGIRFTHWFIGTIGRPQPGVKIEYASYLSTDPESRAWMHASGAIVSKAIPFLLLGVANAADLPSWALWALAAIGVVSVATDILWSTSKSDWKKFKRERRLAQAS